LALEVIGAGFGRTGTLSLKNALERLGYQKTYHMMEVFGHPEHVPEWSKATRGEPIDWDKLFEGYTAAVDWPACNFWRELAEKYPSAKVILSTRDPDKWFQSIHTTIYANTTHAKRSSDPNERARGQWADAIVWDKVFQGKLDDKAYVLDVLRRHEAKVKATISPARLLVFDAAEGWDPLCRFLDKPRPDEPFPRVNTSEQFLSMVAARKRS
jgi:hypothetical protein